MAVNDLYTGAPEFMEVCQRLLPHNCFDATRSAICAMAAEIVGLQGLAGAAFEHAERELIDKHPSDARWALMVAAEVMRKRTARVASTVNAAWVRAATHEDERCFTLQIELLDDRSVCLNLWRDGYISVAIWTGSGEHDLINSNDEGPRDGQALIESYREWCEIGVGKRPAEIGDQPGQTDPSSNEVQIRRSIR
jgi:hypothetical protein